MPESGPRSCLWFESALLPEGWADHVRLTLEDGKILRVETDTAPQPGEPRHGIAVPGLPNLHSHAFQRGMAGLAERRGPPGQQGDNFWTWREVMYRFLDTLSPEDVEAIARFAYVEMLEAGFTRVGEFHYLHHAPDGSRYDDPAELAVRIASAARSSGIALTLLPVFYAHGDFGGAAPLPGQRRFLNSLDGFAELHARLPGIIADLEDAYFGVAPHSLRAVTPEELEHVVTLAPDGPIHIHAAEQVKEVEASIAHLGARPVEWLLDHADIDHRWCLVHATHLSEDETRRLAGSGAVAGLCPITEANLGDGVFPAKAYIGAGGGFGVGTDSNVLIDAAGELRGLEYAQRLWLRARNVLAAGADASTGRRLFEVALAGGGRALGAPAMGLAAGAVADIVCFDPRNPAYAARRGDALLDSWIFAGGPLDGVWRAGTRLVSGGRHRDRDHACAQYIKTLHRLLG